MRNMMLALGAGLVAALAQAGELEGMVTDPAGKPLPHALVAANAAKPVRNAQGETVRHITHSDARGRYRFADLPAGSYGLTATHAVHGAVFVPKVEVGERGSSKAPGLTLATAAMIAEGRVVVRRGALPAGSHVLIGRMSEDSGDTLYADLVGQRYTVALAPGQYVVAARAPGWTSGQHQLAVPGGKAPVALKMHRVRGEKPALAAELLAMEERDQEVRRRYDASGESPAIMDEMIALDAEHEPKIAAILAAHGWPGNDAVGAQASGAMWLLVQHASPALLKQALPAMKKAAQEGELPWSTVALSIDRDLLNDGKKQRYGSQLSRDDAGKLVVSNVEDESRLDERRASVGLEPIAAYLRRFDKP